MHPARLTRIRRITLVLATVGIIASLYYSLFLQEPSWKDRRGDGLTDIRAISRAAPRGMKSRIINEILSIDNTEDPGQCYSFLLLLDLYRNSPTTYHTVAWWFPADILPGDFSGLIEEKVDIKMTEDVFLQVQERFRSLPGLRKVILNEELFTESELKTIGWIDWKNRWHLRDLHTFYFVDHPPETKSGKIVSLITIASLFNRMDIVLNSNWDSIDSTWEDCDKWMGQVAEYSYYDFSNDSYSVDSQAVARQEPVRPDRQRWIR